MIPLLLLRLSGAAGSAWTFLRANPAIAAIAMLCALSGWLWHGKHVALDQRDAARTELADMNARTKAAAVKIDATTNAMASDAAAITKGKTDALASAAIARDTLLDSVRSRPVRPATTSPAAASNGQAAPGCTGAQLYRDDAGFLGGEAGAADNAMISLRACYAQYDAAKARIDALRVEMVP